MFFLYQKCQEKIFKGQILSQYKLGDCVDFYQLKIWLYMSLNFQICLTPEVCVCMCISQKDLVFSSYQLIVWRQ